MLTRVSKEQQLNGSRTADERDVNNECHAIVDKPMEDNRRISSLDKVDLFRTGTLPVVLLPQIPRRIGSNPLQEEIQEFRILVTRRKVLGGGVLEEDLAVDVDKVKIRTDVLGSKEGECGGGWVYSSVVE